MQHAVMHACANFMHTTAQPPGKPKVKIVVYG